MEAEDDVLWVGRAKMCPLFLYHSKAECGGDGRTIGPR